MAFINILIAAWEGLKCFVALFSGTVKPRKLKLDTHMDIGWMYRVYQNQAATSYLSLISLFFFLSSFQKLKTFSTLISGTARPRKFKLGTLVNNGWVYHAYQNQAAATYLSLYFFIFLSLQLPNINIFCHRSGHGAVVSVLSLQSWGRWFDPLLLQSFGWDFKPRSRLHDLVVSGTLN